ncbi:MAG TPA: 2-phosphosulfolactate phosphatase [Chthonomonadaceae bacterium]|nr:2-phosphosulfolactate phosphatase [Chthonomonadaceae bacterium]
MDAATFSQAPYRCRLDWGRRGCRAAAARGEILVIVDTLSFSTAVATAINQAGYIYPCGPEADAAALAARIGGVAAVGRRDVPAQGRFSLSPLTYLDMEPGTRVVLASPNGGLCSRYGRSAPYLFVGALVNAQAVARAVSRVLSSSGLCVTVLACGERWQTPSEDGALRPAVEDYLGAGAILSCLDLSPSPEARVCAGAFRQAEPDLEEILWECGSGRELRKKGFEEDVRHAARLNLYDSVPVMRGEGIERL